MVYTSTSIDRTIAKILRDTRVPDSNYITDMYEWIPEAMGLLKTALSTEPFWEDVKIDFHVGKLTCGLLYVTGVESCDGVRMTPRTGIRRPEAIRDSTIKTQDNLFPSNLDNPLYTESDSITVIRKTSAAELTYQIVMDHIITGLKDGCIRVHGERAPADERGLPLIPDHQDYKEAVYWFVRSKMIQSGYNDPVYGNDDRVCWQRFELHATRAISDINYPTPDEKEAQMASIYFIPPDDYFSSFFNSSLSEPVIYE